MDNTCIFCGKIIPEGMTVCPICMGKLGSTDTTEPVQERMSNNEAIYKLAAHFLGKDWYSYYTNTDDINDEIVDTICKRYRGVDESPVNKWRRRHKRCKFCTHMNEFFECKVKECRVNPSTPRPFCYAFELRKVK